MAVDIFCEYAKTGQSECKGYKCRNSSSKTGVGGGVLIPKGDIRVREIDRSQQFSRTSFYHLECAPWCQTKNLDAEKDLTMNFGLYVLQPEDKKKVLDTRLKILEENAIATKAWREKEAIAQKERLQENAGKAAAAAAAAAAELKAKSAAQARAAAELKAKNEAADLEHSKQAAEMMVDNMETDLKLKMQLASILYENRTLKRKLGQLENTEESTQLTSFKTQKGQNQDTPPSRIAEMTAVTSNPTSNATAAPGNRSPASPDTAIKAPAAAHAANSNSPPSMPAPIKLHVAMGIVNSLGTPTPALASHPTSGLASQPAAVVNGKERLSRAPYTCKRCGQPKKGHVCSVTGAATSTVLAPASTLTVQDVAAPQVESILAFAPAAQPEPVTLFQHAEDGALAAAGSVSAFADWATAWKRNGADDLWLGRNPFA